jgi:hypothetical protein
MRGTPRRVFGLEAFPAQGEGAASGYIYWVIIFLKIKGRYCEPLLI